MAEILVVDDSKVMREMLIACLRGQDFNFSQAGNGLEAIEQLSLKKFDLLLLDLNMPDIGGVEVVEFVRSQDSLRHVPVVIVTTRGDDVSKERAMSAGATRYLTKPSAPELIQAEVAAILNPAKASH